IPVIAILDTNCDPDGITYPIPGNDDAARAIQTYCDLIADAVLDGLAAGQSASGIDIGASEAPPVEPALKAKAPKAEAEAAPADADAIAEEMIAAEQAPAAEAEAPVAEAAPEAAETDKAEA
ncbi:MAG: 30S ribosomal protein S2, partial [Brevundimonas sp.]|nr:30S ribosomal protein S2 [Brevundimonas sp.]